MRKRLEGLWRWAQGMLGVKEKVMGIDKVLKVEKAIKVREIRKLGDEEEV